jgi:hypothetical protein
VFKFQDLGVRIQDSEFKVEGRGLINQVRVNDSGFRING